MSASERYRETVTPIVKPCSVLAEDGSGRQVPRLTACLGLAMAREEAGSFGLPIHWGDFDGVAGVQALEQQRLELGFHWMLGLRRGGAFRLGLTSDGALPCLRWRRGRS